MKVSALITRLAQLDPDTEVVLSAQYEGYDSPIMGATEIVLIARRPRSQAQGVGEYLNAETRHRSRARRIKGVVIA